MGLIECRWGAVARTEFQSIRVNTPQQINLTKLWGSIYAWF